MQNNKKQPIGILQQRRIEAEIIKPIYEIMCRELGQQQAQQIIEEAIAKAAVESAKGFAAQEVTPPSMESFIALQPLWEKDDALQIEVLASNQQQYHYNVHRCRYAEMYRELGLAEIGFLLSCNRDAKFIEGYAPSIKFERHQTLMQGAAYCDFRYDTQPAEHASIDDAITG